VPLAKLINTSYHVTDFYLAADSWLQICPLLCEVFSIHEGASVSTLYRGQQDFLYNALTKHYKGTVPWKEEKKGGQKIP
jgi:hypothetical protein